MMVEGANMAREFAKHYSKPTQKHWDALEHFVGFLKAEKENIRFVYTKPKEMRCVSMVDSNYGTNKEDRRSISGSIFTIGGSIVRWISKIQKSVTLSSTEAEYCALSTCAQEVRFEQQLLEEIESHNDPAIIFEDNSGAIYLVRNRQVGPRTKHIDIRYHFIRDLVDSNKLIVNYINTELNKADILTKNVNEKIFKIHSNNIRNGTINLYNKYERVIPRILKTNETNKVTITGWQNTREDVRK